MSNCGIAPYIGNFIIQNNAIQKKVFDGSLTKNLTEITNIILKLEFFPPKNFWYNSFKEY